MSTTEMRLKNGDPEFLLKPVVHDTRSIPPIFHKKIYGPPPYPIGFSLCKSSGHYGALFAPIPGYKYAEPEPEPEPEPEVKEPEPSCQLQNQTRTAVVHGVPRRAIPPLLFPPNYAPLPQHLQSIQEDILRALAPFNLIRSHNVRSHIPRFPPPGFEDTYHNHG